MAHYIRGLRPNASNYTKGRTHKVLWIPIHYTANDGDTAYSNSRYFTGVNRGASCHYFVDEYDVVLSVEEKDTAWHIGRSDGKYKHPTARNSNSIGIEMCSDKKDGKFYISEPTIQNAVELVVDLLIKYKLKPSAVIRHYDVTGKICPLPMVKTKVTPLGDIEWLKFKNRVEELYKKKLQNL